MTRKASKEISAMSDAELYADPKEMDPQGEEFFILLPGPVVTDLGGAVNWLSEKQASLPDPEVDPQPPAVAIDASELPLLVANGKIVRREDMRAEVNLAFPTGQINEVEGGYQPFLDISITVYPAQPTVEEGGPEKPDDGETESEG